MEDRDSDIKNQLRFRTQSGRSAGAILTTKGSAGNSPVDLAKILGAWDFAMHILGWEDKPLGHMAHFFSQYQASVDSKYHNDLKETLIAEEVERRRENRKGTSLSIMEQR